MILLDGTIFPFFKDLVNQSLKDLDHPVGDDVEFYVCRLLVEMGTRNLDEGPFGERLLSSEEPVVLRSIGDGTLFLSGFFPERLNFRGISTNYYAQVGSAAYGILSVRSPVAVRKMYEEMATHFNHLQRVLVNVREMCDLMGMDAGGVALRWLQTRSPALERRMGELAMFLRPKGFV